jgi:hypothetical protein
MNFSHMDDLSFLANIIYLDFFWPGPTSLSGVFYFFIIILLGPTSLLGFPHICLMVLLLLEYSILSTKVLGG